MQNHTHESYDNDDGYGEGDSLHDHDDDDDDTYGGGDHHFNNNACHSDDEGDGHEDDDECREGDRPRFHGEGGRDERFGLSQESSQVSDVEVIEEKGDFTLTWQQGQQGKHKKRQRGGEGGGKKLGVG